MPADRSSPTMLWRGSRKEVPATPAPGPPARAALPCEALARVLQRARQVQAEPHILMLGELCGENVSFLGERGFRVSVEKGIRTMLAGTFGGALIWDALSLMPPNVARRRMAVLHDALAAGSAVLAVFGAPVAAAPRARARYRILSESSIRVESVEGRMDLVHPYQNREIIRVFEGFDLENLHTRRNGQRDALFFKPWGEARGGGSIGSV